MSVCLLLVMSIFLYLKTRYIYYTASFVHAPIDCLVYVKSLVDFKTQIGDVDCVWCLNKSCYDVSAKDLVTFSSTQKKSNTGGFVKSVADPCVFVSADVICLIYVDTTPLFNRNKLAIEALKQKLKDNGMLLHEKSSLLVT